MTTVMASIGKVASRDASPRTRSTGQVSSIAAASDAATSGGSNGTLYSSRKSTIVVCQLAILVNPEFQNTAAIAKRKINCSTPNGKRSRRATMSAMYERGEVALLAGT